MARSGRCSTAPAKSQSIRSSRAASASRSQGAAYLLSETCLERILEEIARIKPALVIVDSFRRSSR